MNRCALIAVLLVGGCATTNVDWAEGIRIGLDIYRQIQDAENDYNYKKECVRASTREGARAYVLAIADGQPAAEAYKSAKAAADYYAWSVYGLDLEETLRDLADGKEVSSGEIFMGVLLATLEKYTASDGTPQP